MEDFDISDTLKEAIIGYYSGSITSEQTEELLFWIGQSDENRKYFQFMGELWHATGIISKQKYDAAKALESIRKKLKDK